MKNKLFLYFIIAFSPCFSQSYTKLTVGAGPEDFVLDTTQNQERLLISCDERREKDIAIEGNIWSYDLTNGYTTKLVRIDTSTISFNPHGIYLLIENNVKYLFVVNHYENYKKSEVIRYKLKSDTLFLDRRFPYNSTINSVCAISINHFFITNDRVVNGKVIEYTNNQYKTIEANFGMPNGLSFRDSTLYVSSTIGGKVFMYKQLSDGTFLKKEKITRVKGADNLRFYRNKLLTTSHPKFVKFLKHMKNKEKISPSIVYEMDLDSNTKTILFEDNGDIISAASGAIRYKNKLYIAQVFENFILCVNL